MLSLVKFSLWSKGEKQILNSESAASKNLKKAGLQIIGMEAVKPRHGEPEKCFAPKRHIGLNCKISVDADGELGCPLFQLIPLI